MNSFIDQALAIPFRFAYVPDPAPLTNSDVLDIYPETLIPYRVRWAVLKNAEISNLRARKIKAGLWVPEFDGISVNTVFKKRRPGKAYFELEQMPCGRLGDIFSTFEGVDEAGIAVAQYWFNLLKQAQEKLEFSLRRIKTKKKSTAIDLSRKAFNSWLKSVEREFEENYEDVGRTAERKYYLAEAKKTDLCKGRKKQKALGWSQILEDPADTVSTSSQKNLIANVPARRWAGSYSARVSLQFGGGQSGMAQFLVDPLSEVSSISEAWLKKNGFIAEVDYAQSQKIRSVFWRGRWTKTRSVTPTRVEMSGVELPLDKLWLKDAELFYPPNFVSSCCDGILGQDFLRRFTVEFQPFVPHPVKPMSRIKLWNSNDFRPDSSYAWLESIIEPRRILTICDGKKKHRFTWVTAGRSQHKDVDFVCNEKKFHQLPARRLNPSASALAIDQLERNFIFDLPNSRFWIPPEKPAHFLSKKVTDVEYVYNGKDRRLQLKKLSPALRKKGLRRSSVIQALNGIPIEDLDAWEAQRILNGRYGPKIEISLRSARNKKWKTVKVDLTQD